jgi:hypothetical protein
VSSSPTSRPHSPAVPDSLAEGSAPVRDPATAAADGEDRERA